jgi:hypothetical protein
MSLTDGDALHPGEDLFKILGWYYGDKSLIDGEALQAGEDLSIMLMLFSLLIPKFGS